MVKTLFPLHIRTPFDLFDNYQQKSRFPKTLLRVAARPSMCMLPPETGSISEPIYIFSCKFFLCHKTPTKKPLPEDFAPGGGPTILCIYLQRQEASLNPFTYSVVSFFYVIKSPTKKPLPEDFLQVAARPSFISTSRDTLNVPEPIAKNYLSLSTIYVKRNLSNLHTDGKSETNTLYCIKRGDYG